MIFPFESLNGELREFGYLVALVIGFGFGFVLERAGFGRSTKLAAQFYLRDMTVFKVMFSAIVTAMLGLTVASGLGLTEFGLVARQVASWTYFWPMLIGGFLLGMGFIISGYCPGTSVVAASSGNLDGWMTFGGVVLGSVLYSEVQPSIMGFHNSTEWGALFLNEVLGVPVPVVALGVVAMAVLCFFGAEWVERAVNGKSESSTVEVHSTPAYSFGRHFAFFSFALLAVIGLLTIPLASVSGNPIQRSARAIDSEGLAHLILDQPWTVRVIDLRGMDECSAQRVPGAECVPLDQLGTLGLEYASGSQALVLVGASDLSEIPGPAGKYKGEVFTLAGGFEAWEGYALQEPAVPDASASDEVRQAYLFRSALYQSLTGQVQAPPPPAPTQIFIPKKKKGGSCS